MKNRVSRMFMQISIFKNTIRNMKLKQGFISFIKHHKKPCTWEILYTFAYYVAYAAVLRNTRIFIKYIHKSISTKKYSSSRNIIFYKRIERIAIIMKDYFQGLTSYSVPHPYLSRSIF